MRLIKYLLSVCLLTFFLTNFAFSAARGKLHLKPKKTKIRVVRKPGEWLYYKIPSPGNNYDELKYDVRVSASGGDTIASCTLITTKERDDLITAPYVRFLYTNFVEFAMIAFSNATFWSNGEIIRKTVKLPGLPRNYYIACGYGYYNDTMYSHMQGGPEETIVDAASGKIIHRGKMKNARQLILKIMNDSDIMQVGDTFTLRVINNAPAGSTGNVKNIDLDYKFFNSRTGKLLSSIDDVEEVVLRPTFCGNYLVMLKVGYGNNVEWRAIKQLIVIPKFEYTDDPAYLGKLIPNDSVACGLKKDHHQLRDGRTDFTLGEEVVTDHLSGSRRTNFWGGIGRIVTHDRGFFGYILGVNLKLNMPYLLEIKYPEDLPRSFAFMVGDGVYTPGIHTAHTMGQPEPRYFTEQYKFPLKRKTTTARFIIWAGLDEVKNGIYVGVADPGKRNAPFSRKPLLLEISLSEFHTIAIPKVKRTFPKEFLRYSWVESEDALPKDDVRFSPLINSIFYGLNSVAPAALAWNAHGEPNNSILFRSTQYRLPVRQLINGVEYETDKTEDSNKRYDFWSEYLRWAKQLKLNVFPRFEYGGSDDLSEKTQVVKSDGEPCVPYVRPATGKSLTDSADITFPETFTDAKYLIVNGLLNVDENYKDVLRQLIVRRRANFLSTSYSDNAIALFEKETRTKLNGDSFDKKRTDIVARFHTEYRKWYQKKLAEFLVKLQNVYMDTLQMPTGPLLYYHWRRSGMPFENVYYTTLSDWNKKEKHVRCLPFEGFPLPRITSNILINAIGKWTTTEDGLFAQDIPTNTILCVAPVYGKLAANSADYLNLFRRNGKLAVKFVPAIHSTTRIFIRNKKRSYYAGETFYHPRQYMMAEPVAVMAAANPSYIAFEQADSVCFPFAPYARRFFMNYHALPDIPMKIIKQRSDAKGLIVKMGSLNNKIYVAIINNSFEPVNDAVINLPVQNANMIKMLVGDNDDIPFFVSKKGVSFQISVSSVELKSLIVTTVKK